ncbi:hypothetical protein LY76DRAFT_156321 [Colletotrichum caudatum]|nr:hypothetical protein LY76DRAFT_156321 [Colletotrichum caudatum]
MLVKNRFTARARQRRRPSPGCETKMGLVYMVEKELKGRRGRRDGRARPDSVELEGGGGKMYGVATCPPGQEGDQGTYCTSVGGVGWEFKVSKRLRRHVRNAPGTETSQVRRSTIFPMRQAGFFTLGEGGKKLVGKRNNKRGLAPAGRLVSPIECECPRRWERR